MLTVGEKAEALIVGEEIGSFATYTKLYQRPVWPGGESGVTCGIGYDLGQHTADEIRTDWAPHLSLDDVTALCAVAGRKGVDAQNRLRFTQAVIIPIAIANDVFAGSTLPRYAAMTEKALSNCDKLPPDAFGALVSLSYNRGTAGYDSDSDRYSEMADIADAMDAATFDKIPALFESMKRLWPKGSDLWNRRQHEADLFRTALAAPVTAVQSVSLPATPAPSDRDGLSAGVTGVGVRGGPSTPVVTESLAERVTDFVKQL